ncbi:segregation and condensation protein A [Fuchsiella alkaliacetigena]|uniref:segregation and condensation protein A n=1 Tax=Fuchsiella alkaliacetigena TaxID=957042 RepID=UPI00200AF50B|nr:segregation/condensation protein A [Fuchsiella alkaliacetigena]MCK8825723.1 segregation/condensation protein A [Fuchsiella alkaliacetigena]
MSYEVKIDSFEGPIPLLLHLIKEDEMEIYDISIAEITAQYLDYISAMQELDLEIASEFLVMAARLIQIKSTMLLPEEKSQEEDEEEVDPRQQLINRLLEYKKYKQLAQRLKKYEEVQRKKYTKNLESILKEVDTEAPEVNPLEEVKLEQFVQLFEEVISAKEERSKAQQEQEAKTERNLQRLRKKEISIQEKMTDLEQKLTQENKLGFKELLAEEDSRLEIVVSFMALLELMRLRKVVVKQSQTFANIQIYHSADEGVIDYG